MGKFDGKVVIVTGSARGLGRDYARFFAQDGANVVLADVKDTAAAAAEAATSGPRCIGVDTDVTDRGSVEAMIERVREGFGRLDVLVNNAGLWRGLAEAGLLACPDDVWDLAWAVNVTGTLRCYQAAVPLMAEGGFGRVINVSSMASRSGGNPYGLTKNAVEHMTMGMAGEVGSRGITVNCIAPGISAFEAATSQIPNADAVVAANAVKRLGTSRDLYAAMSYLCGDDASWVTGQTLRVDGGAGVR
jgi:NAD(P)-dependent dehydrogenase (short-subunit alcohol dehydrogenase family)